MAEKKPICNYSGTLKELQSGDTLPSSGSGTNHIGLKIAAASSNYSMDPNYVYASRFLCFDSMTITRMSIHTYSSTNGAKCKLAIYASNTPTTGDRPTGSPLGITSEITFNGGIDNSYLANLVSSVSLTAGNYYWLCIIMDTAAYLYVRAGADNTNIGQRWAQTYSSGFPSISTTGALWYCWGNIIAGLT